MDRILSDFIVSLRHAGVRISVSETLDALHSVRLVGYEDRESLRDALMAALPNQRRKRRSLTGASITFSLLIILPTPNRPRTRNKGSPRR